jgi:polysaccharide biosynthesis/export protein
MIKLTGRIMGLLFCTLSMLSSAKAADNYKIGPGDIVKVSVFNYPDLTIETRISEAGIITFPLIGELPVAGLSTGEAERLVAKQLLEKGFIKNPQVLVTVSQFISQQVSVAGDVNRPGQYSLNKVTTIAEVIAMAGGINPQGGEKAIVMRSTADGQKKLEIDLHELFKGDESKNIQVLGGDVIYVPRAPIFYIYGEVQHPGMYRLERNMTIAQAISVAGGLTLRGSATGIKVKRQTAQQTEDDPLELELNELLQPDDVVNVRESWF